ncbi:hypothetical protein FQZ97_782210 [compost metagenome]
MERCGYERVAKRNIRTKPQYNRKKETEADDEGKKQFYLRIGKRLQSAWHECLDIKDER